MKSAIVLLMSVLVSMSVAAPGVFYSALPAPSSDTKVFRDYLGNQATSYAYQDGHSSAVALSRNDVSKHLVAAPAVAVAQPVAYAASAYAAPAYHSAAYAAPAYAAAPVYTASSYQYNHRYPGYTAYAAPLAYYH